MFGILTELNCHHFTSWKKYYTFPSKLHPTSRERIAYECCFQGEESIGFHSLSVFYKSFEQMSNAAEDAG